MKRRVILLSALLLSSFLSMSALAAIDTWTFESPEVKERYRVLTKELRCPKCDGQSIGDSNAPIANDLREVIFNKLQAGQTDDQVIDFMVDRYGEFVLYRPKVEGKTLWLWYGPFLFAGFGLLALIMVIIRSRRRSQVTSEPELNESERIRLEKLLGSRDEGESQ